MDLWYPGAYKVDIGGNGRTMTVPVAMINDIYHIVAASWDIDPSNPYSLDYSGGYWVNNHPNTTYTDSVGIMQQMCPITSQVNGTKNGNYRNNTHEAWNPSSGDLNESRYTDQQAERFADWLSWRAQVHDFVIQDMLNSLPSSHGVGVHRYGITAYSPWNQVGGEVWSDSSNKLCPGTARIAQVKNEIIPRAQWLASRNIPTLPPGIVDLTYALSRGIEEDIVNQTQFNEYMIGFLNSDNNANFMAKRILLTQRMGATGLNFDAQQADIYTMLERISNQLGIPFKP